MIIEFFGLSNSGKSVFKKKLEKKGYSTFKNEDISFIKKIVFFLKHFILHPIKTIYLFLKLNTNHTSSNLNFLNKIRVWRMRNFYLALVLAKYQILKSKKSKIFVDEFSYQSLFMILHRKSTKKEIKKIINFLPKSNSLFLFKGNKILRYKQYSKPHPFRKGTLLPGSGINKKFAEKWMKIMEYNFEIIKKIMLKNFKRRKKLFLNFNFNYPEIYLPS